MEENIKDLVSLYENNELNSKIVKVKFEGLYKNQLTEYINLQNKINTIKDLLIYKHNLTTPKFSNFNKYFYLNKRIKSSNFKNRTNIKNNRNSFNKHFSNSSKKNYDYAALSLNNAVLKKVFKVKRLNSESHITIDSNKNNKQLNTISHKSLSPFLFSKKQNNNNTLSFNKLNKKNNFSDVWYKNYKYKFENMNFFKINRRNMTNLTKIKTIENQELDFDEEDQLKKYEKYCLRGLTLTSEQNYYYKKCKEIDYLYFDNKEEKKNINNKDNNKDSHNINKINQLKCKIINLKPKANNNNIGKKKFINKNGKISIKYSLRDLLNTKNPIKIKI